MKKTFKDYGWTRQQYDTYLKNTFVALNGLLPELTEKMIAKDLEYWKKTTGSENSACGTTACFGGWCASDKFFQKQGLYLEKEEYTDFWGEGGFNLYLKDSSLEGADTAVKLFGNYNLFSAKGDYFRIDKYDYTHWDTSIDEKAKTNRQIIKGRLEDHLKFLLSIG